MSSSPVDQFAVAARRFCEWAESEVVTGELEEAATARRLLTQLIGAAIELRLAEVDVGPHASGPTAEEYAAVFRRFGVLPFNYYSECFDAIVVPSEEPVVADLADDLADIWRDLKSGLRHYDSGEVAAAERTWCFNYSIHWGHHATAALHVIQAWFSKSGDESALC